MLIRQEYLRILVAQSACTGALAFQFSYLTQHTSIPPSWKLQPSFSRSYSSGRLQLGLSEDARFSRSVLLASSSQYRYSTLCTPGTARKSKPRDRSCPPARPLLYPSVPIRAFCAMPSYPTPPRIHTRQRVRTKRGVCCVSLSLPPHHSTRVVLRTKGCHFCPPNPPHASAILQGLPRGSRLASTVRRAARARRIDKPISPHCSDSLSRCTYIHTLAKIHARHLIVPVTSLVANESLWREIFCGANALGPSGGWLLAT